MHRLVITLILMLAAVPWMGLAEEESHAQQEEHVLVLDSTNFHDTVKQRPFIVVEFYAPWCGHCKQLAPEDEKAAAILKANDPPIILAKVDANDESNERLAGPRDVDDIVSYLKKQVGPPFSEIRTGGKIPEFLKSELVPEKNDEPAKIVVVVIPYDGNQIKEVLISFNQSNEDTTEQSKILENQGLTVRDYEGPRDVDGIVSYLSELVPEKNDEPAKIVVVVIPYNGNQSKEALISFNQSNEDTTEQSNITTEVKEETSSKESLQK